MRINQKLFFALVQHKVETLRSKHKEMNFESKNLFIGPTQDPHL